MQNENAIEENAWLGVFLAGVSTLAGAYFLILSVVLNG